MEGGKGLGRDMEGEGWGGEGGREKGQKGKVGSEEKEEIVVVMEVFAQGKRREW